MSSDFNSDVIGFGPCPDTERVVNEIGCQTLDLKTSEQETQTTTVRSSESQVVVDNGASGQSYDPERLLKFLNRVLPYLEEDLRTYNTLVNLNFDQNGNGGSFRGRQESYERPLVQNTLKPEFCKDKVVSSLSWNSSGGTFALAYSEPSHKGWCCHETSIGLFDTMKFNFEKEPPTQFLKVSGCVRCLEFHNNIPSLLAGGLYSGEIIIWDLKHEEVSVFTKKDTGSEAAHVDVITFLTWREDEGGSWLVTAGQDGRIIKWKVSVTNLTFEVTERFLILKQHLTTTGVPNEHLEVLHMDFQSAKGPNFVAACDGGAIFYCSLANAKSLTSFPYYKDPILHSYKARKGFVTQVSCNSDLFASCGTDSEIHIFKYEQETPVMKIFCDYAVYGVKWNSPTELISWDDARVECHRIKGSSAKSLICEVEGGISAVALKKSSIGQTTFVIGNQRGDTTVLWDWMCTWEYNFD